jgi:hypothetical protein
LRCLDECNQPDATCRQPSLGLNAAELVVDQLKVILTSYLWYNDGLNTLETGHFEIQRAVAQRCVYADPYRQAMILETFDRSCQFRSG